MTSKLRSTLSLGACALTLLIGTTARADSYDETLELFRHAGKSGRFFAHAYGYAVFPTIAQGGLGVGAAYGDGQVYSHGRMIGTARVTQVSFGAQAGGKAYSEVIFFKDKHALGDFTSGNFEFGAGASVTVITAAASASAGTTGADASASGGKRDARTFGAYDKGMAVFTIAKGGLMYDASIEGEKFSFKPVSAS